ncbi:MAG: rod-binding protein [Nitrospinota bacterium]|nr:rod-binding protein [Nitrospinota bacterium]
MDIVPATKIHQSISKKMTDQKLGDIQRKLQTTQTGSPDDELMSVAKDFESILINKMLESMRKTVPKSGLLDSFSTEMFESMLDQEIAKEMAKGKGIGLAKMVHQQLTKLNDAMDKPNPGSSLSEQPQTPVAGIKIKRDEK